MADVASDLKTWSTTASSNSPAGGTAVGTGLDDNLRELQKVVRQDLASKGSDIASATTTDLGAVAGLMHDITGTTTITGFGTVSAGIWKIIKFEGALTLTHNATSLILPGGANITTADGDIAIMFSEGSGNWRCVEYQPAATASIAATQAEMESGSTNTRLVTPGRQHYHPGMAKAWAYITVSGGTPTLAASYNVSGITDNGAGDFTVTFSNAMSSTNYAVAGMTAGVGLPSPTVVIHTLATGSFRFQTQGNNAGSAEAADPTAVSVVVYGDI
jgi:hypothetical protein